MKVAFAPIALLCASSTFGLQHNTNLARDPVATHHSRRLQPLKVKSSIADKYKMIKNTHMERALEQLQAESNEPADRRNDRSLQFDNSEECSSDLTKYQVSLLRAIDPYVAQNLFGLLLADSMAFYYKALEDRSESGEYFGEDGEYTTEVLSRMDHIEQFFDASESRSTNIAREETVLLGVHGSVLASRSVRVRICEIISDDPYYDCELYADEFDQNVQLIPRGYRNPLLSLNAFVVDGDSFADLDTYHSAIVKPSILFGDGVLEYMEASSHDSEHDADFVLAHEYGHILQLVLGEFVTNGQGDISAYLRSKLELMADALAGYYMGHALGANVGIGEIDEVTTRAATLGDFVDDTAEGGHGTPGQRECAAFWGAHYARSLILSTVPVSTVINAFDAVYFDIQAGDISVCPGIRGELECETDRDGSNGDDDDFGEPPEEVWIGLIVVAIAVGIVSCLVKACISC